MATYLFKTLFGSYRFYSYRFAGYHYAMFYLLTQILNMKPNRDKKWKSHLTKASLNT